MSGHKGAHSTRGDVRVAADDDVHSFVPASEVAGIMTGAILGGARSDIGHCIAASMRCQASCEAGMARLASMGFKADSDPVRLLRQCAELCELNVLALKKESRLARRTASICFELSNQVARAAWLDASDSSVTLAQDALRLARACKPLLFSN